MQKLQYTLFVNKILEFIVIILVEPRNVRETPIKSVLQFLEFRKHLRFKGTQGGTKISFSYLNMYSLGLNGLIESRLLNIFELVFVQSG